MIVAPPLGPREPFSLARAKRWGLKFCKILQNLAKSGGVLVFRRGKLAKFLGKSPKALGGILRKQ